MSHKKEVLFDFDGVLANSEPFQFEAHRRALEEFGVKITLEDYKENGAGRNRGSLYESMQEKYGVAMDLEEVKKAKREIYSELVREVRLVDGVKEVLERLQGKFKLAIASTTHTDNIRIVLKNCGAEKFFDAISSSKDLDHGKPFPDVYLDAMNKLGLLPEECVAVEDSHNGIKAAKDACTKCIAIPNEFTKVQDLSAADLHLDNISQLTEDVINDL